MPELGRTEGVVSVHFETLAHRGLLPLDEFPLTVRLRLLGRARARGSTIRARSPLACPVIVFEEVDVESALALIAASWAIAMALGPVLQIRKLVEHRSSRNISIGYFLVLLVGFVLWFAYGIAASNFVLIVPNAVAAVVISATIIVALRYRQLPQSD